MATTDPAPTDATLLRAAAAALCGHPVDPDTATLLAWLRSHVAAGGQLTAKQRAWLERVPGSQLHEGHKIRYTPD